MKRKEHKEKNTKKLFPIWDCLINGISTQSETFNLKINTHFSYQLACRYMDINQYVYLIKLHT